MSDSLTILNLLFNLDVMFAELSASPQTFLIDGTVLKEQPGGQSISSNLSNAFRTEVGSIGIFESKQELPTIDLSPSSGFVICTLAPRTYRQSQDSISSILKAQLAPLGRGRDAGVRFARYLKRGKRKANADFMRETDPISYETFDQTQIFFKPDEMILEASKGRPFREQLALVDQDTSWHIQQDLPNVRTTVRRGLLTARESLALLATHLEVTGNNLLREYEAIRTGTVRVNRVTNEVEEVVCIDFKGEDQLFYVSVGDPNEVDDRLGIAPVYYITSRVHLPKI